MTVRTDDGTKNKRPKGPGVCLTQEYVDDVAIKAEK